MEFVPLGDTGLTVHLSAADPLSPATLADALQRSKSLGLVAIGVIDVVPAFDAVTVIYDPVAFAAATDPIERLCRWIKEVTAAAPKYVTSTAARDIELPVHYGGETDGPDLVTLAKTLKMSESRIIDLHGGAQYTVAAVGFLPGFAYLAGLPKRLQVPRRATPRVKVPAGSVAIGGPYTGVYPIASPGGWHIIGRTATTLFDPSQPAATPFRVGNRVKFVEAAATRK